MENIPGAAAPTTTIGSFQNGRGLSGSAVVAGSSGFGVAFWAGNGR